MPSPKKSWMLLAVTERRQYQGNVGYLDELRSAYRFDSDVGNHLRVGAGDFIVLRRNREIVGAASIERVESAKATKERRMCPVCSSTAIRHRRTISPPWRCTVCKREFPEPTRREVEVDAFTALYGDTFLEPKNALDEKIFRETWRQRGDQMSMRELDTEKLESILRSHWEAALHLISRTISLDSLPSRDSEDDDDEDDPGYVPSNSDQRHKVLRSIKERRGQRGFRNALLHVFEQKCAISDCGLVDLLEAAHIEPYRGEAENHFSNGLLLRADLHTLFDLNLMAIEPNVFEVRFHPRVVGHGFVDLEGKKLSGIRFKRISRTALRGRWEIFQRSICEQ
jgi:putative restriction endonuclease